MFVDGYKRSNIVKNCANFLKDMEELKLYMIEFNSDSIMKPKLYLLNCIVEGKNK